MIGELIDIKTVNGYLSPLVTEHSQDWYALVESNRGFLSEWLPWPSCIQSTQDAEDFIHKLILEKGPQFSIVVDGAICGGIGFYHVDKQDNFATLGYWLGQEYTGRGLMGDAVNHLLGYGFSVEGFDKVEIRCAEGNIKSRRIAEKLGFFNERVQLNGEMLHGRNIDHVVYSLFKEELSVL